MPMLYWEPDIYCTMAYMRNKIMLYLQREMVALRGHNKAYLLNAFPSYAMQCPKLLGWVHLKENRTIISVGMKDGDQTWWFRASDAEKE